MITPIRPTPILYRPEIDGLRALAVLAVVGCHLGIGPSGGYIGVDIFYVISGFLITGIIRRELENNTFSLSSFWERRIRRLFPALFAVNIAILLMGHQLLPPPDLEALARSSIAQSFFLSNFYFWLDTGYFEGPAEHKPLLHTWSLAIEEQFYLLLPIMLLAQKQKTIRYTIASLTIIGLASLSLSLYCVAYYREAAFYLLPMRAWELIIGCLLATLPDQHSTSVRRDSIIGFCGIVAILIPLFSYSSETPFPGLSAIPPVLGTAAVIYATKNHATSLLRRTLSLRPLAFVGIVSYPLYLWHWPVIVFTKEYFGHFEEIQWKQTLFSAIVSSVLAILTWAILEVPIRRKYLIKNQKILFSISTTLLTTTVLVATFFIMTNGIAGRTSLAIDKIKDLEIDINWKGDPIIPKSDKKHLDLMVIGDSHADILSHPILFLNKSHGLNCLSLIHPGHIPLPNVKTSKNYFHPNLLQEIDRLKPRHILLAARWSYYLDGASTTDSLLMLEKDRVQVELSDDNFVATNKSQRVTIVAQKLLALVDFCKQRGIVLWIFKEVPETREPFPARTIYRFTLQLHKELSNKRNTTADYKARTETFNTVLEQLSGSPIRLLDPAPMLFDDQNMTMNYIDGRALYRDNNHLTRWGAQRLVPLMESFFHEMQQHSNLQDPN